jgi:hypothetical protein
MIPAATLAFLLALQARVTEPMLVDSAAALVRSLPAATVAIHADRHEVVVDLAPVDVPAGMSHQATSAAAHEHTMPEPMGDAHAHNPAYPPVMGVDLPLSGWISAFRIELVDSAGRALPRELLHHYNLIDPWHRELFLPISRRVLAAGSETGEVRLNRFIFGTPFQAGVRLVASAMLHNPTGVDYRGVRTRLVMTYAGTGRWYPLLRGYPWQLDVAFPVGDKSFDLPPGRTVKTFEGAPAIPGRILAIGGHAHDRAVAIELRDATTNALIWRAEPIADSTGRVVGIPRKSFVGWRGIGEPILPTHRYRVTVVYDNPTGQTIAAGGMGVVAGLFEKGEHATWPEADQSDALYRSDLLHALRMESLPR